MSTSLAVCHSMQLAVGIIHYDMREREREIQKERERERESESEREGEPLEYTQSLRSFDVGVYSNCLNIPHVLMNNAYSALHQMTRTGIR